MGSPGLQAAPDDVPGPWRPSDDFHLPPTLGRRPLGTVAPRPEECQPVPWPGLWQSPEVASAQALANLWNPGWRMQPTHLLSPPPFPHRPAMKGTYWGGPGRNCKVAVPPP